MKTLSDKCKIYKGTTYTYGYPQRNSKLSKGTRNAHRVFWEEAYGAIPKGLLVMHLCDNRECVNLEHLRLGTHKENMQDMVQKGRSYDRKGEKSPVHKLTTIQVKEIKELSKQGLSQRQIARKFNVTQTCVMLIINNKRRIYG